MHSRFGFLETLDPLLYYQYEIIKKIGKKKVCIESEYDFYSYFSDIFSNKPSSLEKKRVKMLVEDPAPVNSFAQLAREPVWYGRNRRETDYSSTHYSIRFLTK